ncbi:MAG TPA: A24 family peptidase [Candidatus Limnocylindrales bacterium]|nr:A24 family peptidase [Candidatus Limnocylindrales bacterium]
MTPLVPLSAVTAVIGLVLGVLADRLATRWPEHEPPDFPAGRRVGWRTVVCGLFGAFAFAVLPARFGDDWLAFALFGAWFATLVVGLATDLDQRLLPDVLTLPVVPVAAIYAVSGLNPLVGGELLPALLVATVVPAVLYVASLPFGAGAFGQGDVKLLVGVGLMAGGIRAFTGIVSGLFLAGVVLAILVVTRRITLRSYVPYGPFLIFGAVWGIFVRA